jgi:5-methyltetrahydropteroyltriglutamate--homocysteine methyltransferase
MPPANGQPQRQENEMNDRDAATRAETVGSLLRPDGVVRVLTADEAGLDETTAGVLDEAVLAAIRIQEDAGLDIVTDGEMRRTTWAQTPRYLDCFERRPGDGPGLDWRGGSGPAPPPPISLPFPVVVRPVSEATRTGNMAGEYAFLVKHAHTRTKYCLAAPSYHRRYWSDQHSRDAYRSCEEYLTEIRDFERAVVAELLALGCDYIQLDAPNYGSYCDPGTRARLEQAGRDVAADLAFDAELDNSLLDGLGGITRALHICRGNAPGGRWHSAGGYGAISADLFPRLTFDRLLLEYDSGRAGGFEPLGDVGPGTVVVLGLLTTKSGQPEDPGAVAARVGEAAAIKPLAELAVSTQCGFASGAIGNPVTPDEQAAKLRLVTAVARRLWPR